MFAEGSQSEPGRDCCQGEWAGGQGIRHPPNLALSFSTSESVLSSADNSSRSQLFPSLVIDLVIYAADGTDVRKWI